MPAMGHGNIYRYRYGYGYERPEPLSEMCVLMTAYSVCHRTISCRGRERVFADRTQITSVTNLRDQPRRQRATRKVKRPQKNTRGLRGRRRRRRRRRTTHPNRTLFCLQADCFVAYEAVSVFCCAKGKYHVCV